MRQGQPITERQKKIVAVGRVLGKSRGEIAREADLAVQTVSTIVHHDPETLTLIEKYKNRHEAELYEMFKRSLEGMKKDLGAEEAWLRVQTRDQVLRTIQAGDKTAAVQVNVDQRGDYSLMEIMERYLKITGESE
jgi:hypothetical protein